MLDALAAAFIDAPSRLASSTAITVSTGCVVTPDAISSDARFASTCALSASTGFALVCAESCTVCAGSGCTDAEVCARASVGANGVTSAFAFCVGNCANRCIVRVCVPVDEVTVLAAVYWFVPERNQHQGADRHCGVNDGGESQCPPGGG